MTPMAKTYASIQEQIRKLEQEAAGLKAKEIAGVVSRIKEAITVYGLTPADLFGTSSTAKAVKAGKKQVASKKKAKKQTAKSARAIKYTDGTNSWVGHGKRPRWFVDALAAGKTADDMLVSKT